MSRMAWHMEKGCLTQGTQVMPDVLQTTRPILLLAACLLSLGGCYKAEVVSEAGTCRTFLRRENKSGSGAPLRHSWTKWDLARKT